MNNLFRSAAWILAGFALTSSCQRASSDSGGHDEHESTASAAASASPPVAPIGDDSRASASAAVPSNKSHSGHDGSTREGVGGGGPAPVAPAGYAAFVLDAERARAVGLRLSTVEERDFSRVVRTTGAVVLDETRTSHVHAKVRGWIENVSVDFVGKRVVAGAPLCTIYSQEVLAAELEFLSVLDQTLGRAPPSGAFAQAEQQAQTQLVAAARRRLLLWDVPEEEIERLEKTRTPRRTFTLVAPRSGVVVAKQALAGMFIDPSVELYLISDIRKLWVLADVYESDVPGVQVGDNAQLSIEGLGGQTIPAQVTFLPPSVEEATRTLKVRFELDNTDGRIRPGAFATVEMNIDLGRSLAVPEEAVIHSGREGIVFVSQDERIEPRQVKLGPLVGAHYRVEQGLRAGESVAVGAQFLIDSESRLRATSGKGPSHGGH